MGHLFSQHTFIISVCWPLPKCWRHSCECDTAQASGSSALKEDRPPGASGWKWAEVCAADQSARCEFGSRAKHPSSTPGLEAGECCSQGCSKQVEQIYDHRAGLEMTIWTWVWDEDFYPHNLSLTQMKDNWSLLVFRTDLPNPIWSNWKRHHWILWMGWAGDLKWSSTNWAGGNLQRACWLEGVDVRETKAFCEQGSQGIDYTVVKCGPQGSRLSPISPVSLWEQGGKENRLFWEGKCIT